MYEINVINVIHLIYVKVSKKDELATTIFSNSYLSNLNCFSTFLKIILQATIRNRQEIQKTVIIRPFHRCVKIMCLYVQIDKHY